MAINLHGPANSRSVSIFGSPVKRSLSLSALSQPADNSTTYSVRGVEYDFIFGRVIKLKHWGISKIICITDYM